MNKSKMEVSALETEPPTMKEAIEAESITSMKLGDEPAEGDLSILSKQSYVSHRGYVPPERVTGWINVIFIIMADLIGTGIVGLRKLVSLCCLFTWPQPKPHTRSSY